MIELFKAKSLKKTRESLTSNVEEKTREKAILKEGIGTNRETTTRRGRTRASLFGTYIPSKMGFAVRGSKKQRGRSMVEMLGVLAIIGVLSIGGIQGYTIAMRKYRANEILNLANKYAFTAYSACQTAMEKDSKRYYVDDRLTPYLYNNTPMYLWHCPDLAFTNSGLGSLPAGVAIISVDNIGSTTFLPESYYGDDPNFYSEDNVLPVGTDFVMVYMDFDSKDLCDVVFAISGTNSFSTDSSCNESNGRYHYNYTAFVEN